MIAAAMSTTAICAGNHTSTPITMAASSSAVKMRDRSALATMLHLRTGQAEPALALCEVGQRRLERCVVEIRPERVGEIKLGVREIPQQEVADALLAAGAYEQVGFRRQPEL